MTALDIANKRSDAGPIGVLLALAWRAPQLPEPVSQLKLHCRFSNTLLAATKLPSSASGTS